MTVLDHPLLRTARVGHLALLAPDGSPRALPVCFAFAGGLLYTPIDEKPKRGGELARLRYLRRDPRVSLVVDRYEEDWTKLAWVRVDGVAEVVERGDLRPEALAALRAKYPQYRGMRLEALPLIAITPLRVSSWEAAPR